jgi:hypothetical protein
VAHVLEARFQQSLDLFRFLCYLGGEFVAGRLKHCPFDIYVYFGTAERLVAKAVSEEAETGFQEGNGASNFGEADSID